MTNEVSRSGSLSIDTESETDPALVTTRLSQGSTISGSSERQAQQHVQFRLGSLGLDSAHTQQAIGWLKVSRLPFSAPLIEL